MLVLPKANAPWTRGVLENKQGRTNKGEQGGGGRGSQNSEILSERTF